MKTSPEHLGPLIVKNAKGNTEQYLCYGVIVLAAYHKVLYND